VHRFNGLHPHLGFYTWVDITPSLTRSRFRLTSRPTTYSLLWRTPYSWSYYLGNTQATSICRVYSGWGSRWVTCHLADPEAVAEITSQVSICWKSAYLFFFLASHQLVLGSDTHKETEVFEWSRVYLSLDILLVWSPCYPCIHCAIETKTYSSIAYPLDGWYVDQCTLNLSRSEGTEMCEKCTDKYQTMV
jgi:hypothetical protein